VTGRDDPSNPTWLYYPNASETVCFSTGYGPAPLSLDIAPNGDVSLGLGLRNLAGGMVEWTLDSFHPYSDACWLAATIDSPLCWERAASLRTLRGQGWDTYPAAAVGREGLQPGQTTYSDVSFRCAYPARPAKGK
jgi:formylglycine-generating enzyme required for sulfatase activity